MIVGVGLDVVTVGDCADPDRRLIDSEERYCAPRVDRAACRGARIAAKTALFRALGIAADDDAPWIDVEVLRSATGKPELALRGRALRCKDDLGVTRVHLSMTHTGDHAAAAVVVEC